MTLFGEKKKMPDGPPSYDELQSANTQGNTPLHLSRYGPNEYPEEKKTNSLEQGSSKANFGVLGSGTESYEQGGGNKFSSASDYANYVPQNGDYGPQNGKYGPNSAAYAVSANYAVPLQMTNIAYDTEGEVTRPGYKEYLQKDQERAAQGDFPKPREVYSHGAPLNTSRKGGKSGSFPGARSNTYYNASEE